MRYTEVRMAAPAQYMLADIDKDTVDFQDNYDGKQQEPTVLPARFPNMLVNGAGGIAVGMATNIPPHNLGEVIDACQALIRNPDLSSEQLIDYVPAPDFPTGALILGRSGARKAYLEGRGSVIIRAKTRVEEIRKDRYAIVIDEIPYQVNKASMIERIADLVREKKLEGISGVADESDRVGVARGDRAQARRHARGGAEPAFPLHPDADELRLQHAGAQRRQARAADAARLPDRLSRLPRRGRRPPHRVRAEQGARPGACPVRSGRGGVQRGRGGPHHPPVRRRGGGT